MSSLRFRERPEHGLVWLGNAEAYEENRANAAEAVVACTANSDAAGADKWACEESFWRGARDVAQKDELRKQANRSARGRRKA